MSLSPKQLVDQLRRQHGNNIGLCEHTDDLGGKDIFIAWENAARYISPALEKGALAIVCQLDAPGIDEYRQKDNVIEVQNLRQFVLSLIEEVYGPNIEQVQLIGVTGTNGKTSTAYFTCQLLELLGVSAGYIGTLGFGVVSAGLVNSRNTTPDFVTLYRYISDLYEHGCTHVVMEVSSHALALNRIQGLDFSAGVFTNLSRDHLDFHGSMEAYEDAKLSFFTDYDISNWIVNTDYPAGRRLAESELAKKAGNLIVYGRETEGVDNYFQYGFIKEEGQQSSLLDISHAKDHQLLKADLAGGFNLENLMAAVLVCHVLGYRLEEIARIATLIKPVPGRMECIEDAKGVKICVDYAHTPAGVEAVMEDRLLCHESQRGKLWSVFGCGGDRDKGKRPLMGKVVADHSDRIIITDDNVRGDQAEAIICDILSGIDLKPGVIVCRDRKKAIGCVLDSAIRNDLVLLLGKGNESSITYGHHRLFHRDVDTVVQHMGQS